MIVIATFVIVVDRVLRALYPDISRAIGPYVGLIITNCILMGRAEAFYIPNNVCLSILDSIGNGFGYTYILVLMADDPRSRGVRHVLGFRVMPAAGPTGWSWRWPPGRSSCCPSSCGSSAPWPRWIRTGRGGAM